MKKAVLYSVISLMLITSCKIKDDDIVIECIDSSIICEDQTFIKETSTESLPDFTLNTHKILLTATCQYMYDAQDPYKSCIMCIRTDGEIYAVTCPSEQVTNGNFFKNLYECDDTAFEFTEDMVHFGTLSKDELTSLIEYTENIDLKSEYYTPDSDVISAVEETETYTFYCYKWNDEGKRQSFPIKSYGNMLGTSYETKDKNAINALELVKNSEYYDEWLQICNRTLGKFYMTATVLEKDKNSILVEPKYENVTDKIYVSTNLPQDEFLPDIKVGDIVEIAYDGNIAETYPAQIYNVYSIYVCESETIVEEETLSQLELDEMWAVNIELKKIFTDEFQDMSTEEKAEYSIAFLNNLSENGTKEYPYSLIQKSSIYYNGNDMISFSYKCGAGGGIKLEPFDPIMN